MPTVFAFLGLGVAWRQRSMGSGRVPSGWRTHGGWMSGL